MTDLERDVVRVSGDDATTFLQSQLSQDIAALEIGGETRSFVLQPNGKVVGWFTVIRAASDEYLLDADGGAGEAIITRLERFKLRTKVSFALEHRDAPVDEWARITEGLPAMGREITDATIPGELGAHVIDTSVSFTKGCYTGQELVARVDSRGGNVPKPIRLVHIDGEVEPPAGATIEVEGRDSGTLTSIATGPDGRVVALAIVARRVEPPAEVTITWDDNRITAHVATLPA